MNFFDYCINNQIDLIRSLEQKLCTNILDIDIEHIENDFVLFVSTKKGNNRLLCEMQGIVKCLHGVDAEIITTVLNSEKDKYNSIDFLSFEKDI